MIDYAALGAAVVGGIVWSLRLEGRVNTLDALQNEREKHLTEYQADIKDRLERIEGKIDSLNGYR